MTSIDVRNDHANASGPESEVGRRKAVLYCPVCGNESPVDGNWVVTTTESQQEFSCPDCEQVVALR